MTGRDGSQTKSLVGPELKRNMNALIGWSGAKSEGENCESVQSGENDTGTQGGPALWTPLFSSVSSPLRPSLSSGGWHFPSSVWPLTEGGMNGGVERGERAGWRVKGGWAADGHLNARLQIYWKGRRGRKRRREAASVQQYRTFGWGGTKSWCHTRQL